MSMSEAGKERLKGRRVIVTGAASGIGKAIAELFHREGAKLTLIDVNEASLLPVAQALEAIALPLDLGNAAALAPAVDRAAAEMGGLDGLVNCAAIGVARPIADTDLDF